MTRSTVVVHPGVQHSADLAAALDDIGALSLLVTGLQVGTDAPHPWGTSLARRVLERRTHRRLPDERIHRIHPAAYAAVRALRGHPDVQLRLQRWLDEGPFVRDVLRQLPEDTANVVATDFGSGPLLTALAHQRPELTRILDVSHPADGVRRRMLHEDARRWGRPVEAYDDFTRGPVLDQSAEYAHAQVLVVASQFSKDNLLYRPPQARVEVIPYGVATGPVPPARAVRRRPRVVFVGAMSERKGLSFLLDAARSLPQLDFDLIGRRAGGYRLGALPTNVRHRSGLDRAGVAQAIGDADLLVLPSMCEGFGRVLLEALAAGVPLLATTASGAPDILDAVPLAPVTVIHPDERVRLSDHILAALETEHSAPGEWYPHFVEEFGEAAYRRRWARLLDSLAGTPGA